MSELLGFNDKKKDIVFEKLKKQLEQNGLKIDSIDNENLIHINIEGNNLEISLENVRRNYERDADESHISDLVQTILSYSVDVPSWENSKNNVYVQLFPNDFDFKDLIYEKVTEEFSKIYVVSENEKLTWITPDILIKWNISELDLIKQADLNANELLTKTKVDVEIIENRKLGMIEVQKTFLKSSLLFASKMKEKLKSDFGFTFYAVIPVRDFCYIFSEKDFEFFANRIGKTVVQEYQNSGYPITTEILFFSENGITAIGKYPTEK
jgi:hypothetical protein